MPSYVQDEGKTYTAQADISDVPVPRVMLYVRNEVGLARGLHVWLEPEDARKLAAQLVEHAEQAERMIGGAR